MKKIIFLGLLTIFLIGCSQESPIIPDPVASKEYSQPIVNNNQPEKVTFKDITICPLSDDDYSSQAMCLWREAMNQKALEICNSLPEFSPNLNHDYLNASDCKNTISYTHDGNRWGLTGGIPRLGDDGSTYEGRAVLKGWVVHVPSYIDNPVAHFHVIESSMENLPFGKAKFSDFNLVLDNSADFIESLEARSSESNPISIVATKISYRLEGTPRMTIEKIAQ